MIELRAITPDSYAQALGLSVHPEQSAFVAGITKTLADAYVWQDSVFRLVFNDEVAVGYLLVFPFEREFRPIVNIVRLAIDARHQGRGLGGGLLEATMKWISGFQPAPSTIRVSTLPSNDIALSLYRSHGFHEAGIENGEIALYYEIDVDQ
jgi:ribosomal protein S18 acetylase RimI-like enzyme